MLPIIPKQSVSKNISEVMQNELNGDVKPKAGNDVSAKIEDNQRKIELKKYHEDVLEELSAIRITEEELLALQEKATVPEEDNSYIEGSIEELGERVDNVEKNESKLLTKITNLKDEIYKKLKEKAGLLGLLTGVVIAGIIALMAWWNSKDGPGNHEGGLIGWVKDLIVKWWKDFDAVKFFEDSASLILDVLQSIGDGVFLVADKLVDYLMGVDWNLFAEKIKKALEVSGDLAAKIIDTVYSSLFGSQWEKAKLEFNDMWYNLTTWYREFADPISRWFYEVDKHGGFINYVEAKIQQWWYDLISGIDWVWPFEKLGDVLMGDGVKAFKQNAAKIKASMDEYDEKKSKANEKADAIHKLAQEIGDKRAYRMEAEELAAKNGKKISKTNRGSTKIDISKISINNDNRTTHEGKNKQPWMKVITSKYGVKEDVRKGNAHSGVDFRAPTGTEITAVAPGIVEAYQPNNPRGGKILVTKGDDGKRVLYMHLSKYKIKPGSRVEAGQVIALSGNSGSPVGGGKYAPHIHIGVKEVGTGKTEDPIAYINSLKINNNQNNSIFDSVKDTQVVVNNTNKRVKGNTINNNNTESGLSEDQARHIDHGINKLGLQVGKLSAAQPDSLLLNSRASV